MIAIKKNWIEKGIRDDDFGSNPHSNGELFSLSKITFFEIKFKIKSIMLIIVKAINVEFISSKINYACERFFDWKSNIIIILHN